MSESITISKKTPDSKSQQYDFLREEGLKYIQKVAGKIWTDYNIHDPGVTILEVLAYAITELGYRASYNIEDLLANDPDDKNARDIRNFFTARQILPNAPVTINDYRKLMIDVDVHDKNSADCKHVGVKNAWIEKSKSNEIPIYVHQKESKLSYLPDPSVSGQSQLDIGILYDILLEFEKCDGYGDLNENSLTRNLVIEEHALDTNVNGLTIKITVDFPRWDSENTNWKEIVSVKADVQNIKVQFFNVPNGYEFTTKIENNLVKLKGTITTASDIVPVPGLSEIETKINNFIYYNADSLLAFYLLKIKKIKEIVEAVKARLHANRNLCEDFYKISALKVEKIAVCADVELAKDADVEAVQAEIYHKIAKFLSPAVYFYTLDEMLDKCKKLQELSISEIDTTNKYFKVDRNLDEQLNAGDTISIKGSRSNDGDYTVKSVSVDTDTSTSKVYVTKDISSELLTEGELFTFYITVEEECLSVDRIFEGPALEHGFIDDNELEKADRKKYIHVSDIIQIIMDVKGVISVKTIQIANIPQDNKDGSIESNAVRWCLQLAFEQNYVPRLSVSDSKIVFYKDQLPFRASATKVDELLETLEKGERVAKLYNPVLDFEVPKGVYRDLEDYESIQNEFPLTYGIGDEGLPNLGKNNEFNERRKASARQLKGYLMHFDQLLANYFSQLAHVKDLFSMNAEKDEFGNYIIGRTYYTQPLFDIVPNADELYVDKNGHAVSLDNIAESENEFFVRKNKFLDHLIGRFAENFTDYALLTIQIEGGVKASNELVADKLAFLNAYPAISSLRGTGFNHQETCQLWHIGNISGLRRRASFLTGIDEPKIENLHFSSGFAIVQSGDNFEIRVSNAVPELLLKSGEPFKSEPEAKLALEKLVINGLDKNNYQRLSEDGGANWYFKLICNGSEVLGISERSDYPDNLAGGEMDTDINELVQVFTNEFYNNIESNRNNLACPLLNYIQYKINVGMENNPPVAVISYELFAKPFSSEASDKLITGEYIIEGEDKAEVDIISVDTATKTMVIKGNIAEKLKAGDVLVVEDSQDNDGVYTVVSATDISDKTEIVVDEAIPSSAVPYGELLYNTETEDDLLKNAEEQLHEILWQLLKNAVQKGKYYFSSESGDYRFRFFNNYGVDLAESVTANFNEPLANEISNLVSAEIQIKGSAANDGEYTVSAATANGAEVTVIITGTLPSTTADGTVGFTETFNYSASKEENSITVEADLTGRLFKGDFIKITGSESVDGSYTIFSIALQGADTVIKVEEPVPADDDTGQFSYSKSFKIEKVTPNTITFKGGYDEKAVQLFIDFIIQKFFSNEGFHVVEHILLRPRVKGKHFVETDAETFTEGLRNLGSLYFNETIPLFSISSATNVFRVEGNLTDFLDTSKSTAVSSEIVISGAGKNDGVYRVKNVSYDAVKNRTAIKTEEAVYSTILNPAIYGNITYLKGTAISAISANNLGITVSDAETLKIKSGDIVEIRGSSEKINDGRYRVKQVVDNGATQEIFIDRMEAEVEDSLLPIVLDNDKCDDCRIQDPYTCVASVIIPHWQGRFDNMDFRRFFERQLRMEAPAHVFLVICWISCEQMTEFEQKYKAWLIENARKEKDFGMLSARLNDLIDILGRLRNVYPSGTLYDCEKDETLENAIILNNSVLGND
jgi:hypothetical protein